MKKNIFRSIIVDSMKIKVSYFHSHKQTKHARKTLRTNIHDCFSCDTSEMKSCSDTFKKKNMETTQMEISKNT